MSQRFSISISYESLTHQARGHQEGIELDYFNIKSPKFYLKTSWRWWQKSFSNLLWYFKSSHLHYVSTFFDIIRTNWHKYFLGAGYKQSLTHQARGHQEGIELDYFNIKSPHFYLKTSWPLADNIEVTHSERKNLSTWRSKTTSRCKKSTNLKYQVHRCWHFWKPLKDYYNVLYRIKTYSKIPNDWKVLLLLST